MSSQPSTQETRRRIDRLTRPDAPDATVPVPLEALGVILDWVTVDSAYEAAAPDDPIRDAVTTLTTTAITHGASSFDLTTHGPDKLLISHNGDVVGGFSTSYHSDGEAHLYLPGQDAPAASIRGYATPKSDTSQDTTPATSERE